MDLATLHMDTYKIVTMLREKGYTKTEAEGFIQAIQEITLSGVATKQDIVDVREGIQEVHKEIQSVRNELKSEIQTLFQWMVGLFVGVIGMNVAIFLSIFFGS